MKRIITVGVGSAVFVFLLTAFAALSSLNHFKADGTIRVSGLTSDVTVKRDEKGMSYIKARSLDDAIFAQGFISAQDRLFQMELTRRAASGRLAEVIGEEGLSVDIQMRTLGFAVNAAKHAAILDDETRHFFQVYTDGVNAYIGTMTEEHPLELKLLGVKLDPWTIEDSLSILYLMGWNSAANISHEVIIQMLIEKVGFERAQEIFPVNLNPDDPDFARASRGVADLAPREPFEEYELASMPDLLGRESLGPEPLGVELSGDDALMDLAFGQMGSFAMGSNNWVVGSAASQNGSPILSNDPHLNATTLPGPLYPIGLSGPDFRVVGAGLAGIPGMIIGRSEFVAAGVTNAYGDTQDLYIETLDPAHKDHYLEGEKSFSFDHRVETIRVRDSRARGGFREVTHDVRSTHRGPVVSSILSGFKTDNVVTLRWSAFEAMEPRLGLDALLTAKTAGEVRDSLASVTQIGLNIVFADAQGNVGWQTTGRVPIRRRGHGMWPATVSNGDDDWIGWIPYDEMPQSDNPSRGWIGTANHKTIDRDYPYYYSSYFSPYYRYERMSQVLDQPGLKSVDDHWALQRDIKNLMAERLAPAMAGALLADEATRELAEIIADWDHIDRASEPASTIFQTVYRRFAYLTYIDELGEALTMRMLQSYYYWHVRLERMVVGNDSVWFDDVRTDQVTETRDDLFRRAARDVMREMTQRFGPNPKAWQWGKLHQMQYYNPIRRRGFGSRLVGGSSNPMDGSGETLYRAIYGFDDPAFRVVASACLRMVVDFSDDEKVLAVMPSGVSGRTFNRHFTDQTRAYMSGERRYWWFSDEAIERNKFHELRLVAQP